MIRAYKYRLYPNAEQKAYFARCFGATRYCYNYCVRAYDEACREGRQVSGYDIMFMAREHMKTLKWMSDVDYEVKESAPLRFDNALGKFKRHEANRPREHKKSERPFASYTTGSIIKVDFKHDLVQLPKIGIVRVRLHRSFEGEITSATVKREADGNYYISFNVHSDVPATPLKYHTQEGTVGIDVGLRHLATTSTGEYFDLPDTERDKARIKFLKKRHEQQKPGSRRYNRTAIQIARLKRHLANVTKDTHHKTAALLCSKFDTICMETLNIEGMKRGKVGLRTPTDITFNSMLHNAALALFVERVKKKAEDTGTNFVSIDRFEPTTKMCHVCGYVLPTIDLHISQWTCPECGAHHDRDVNAAINIRRKGLEELNDKPKSNTKNLLPLAEGKVKPAKEATGCDLRTGKGIVKIDRQPKAQIADGTAPPRIFNGPLASGHPFRYFKYFTLANMAGVSNSFVKKCIEESLFIDPPEEIREQVIKLLETIKIVAADLRQLRMTDDTRAYTRVMLGKMNKVARIDHIIQENVDRGCTFAKFREKKHSPYIVKIINDIATADFPNRLDAAVDVYLRPLLPSSELVQNSEPPKMKKLLRRERKNDTLIVPIDNPKIISYEEQIFSLLRIWPILKQLHIYQNIFNKIVGNGTMFRPEKCTHTRMTTFISALYSVADTLSGIDTTLVGQRERMDQLYYVNKNFINVEEIVRRYIDYGKNDAPHIFFTRAGKTTPAFYNEHYRDIMRAITYDFPKLIREAAAYLTSVYKINCDK